MKNQTIQYLALDVHQATVVASLRDESGKILMRATVPTEIKAILTLVKIAGPRVQLVGGQVFDFLAARNLLETRPFGTGPDPHRERDALSPADRGVVHAIIHAMPDAAGGT